LYAYGRAFYIILEDDANIFANIRELPCTIAKCPVRYELDWDLNQPAVINLQSKRYIKLTVDTVNNTPCNKIRPGVIAWSISIEDPRHPQYVSTTASILVSDVNSNKFITAASHGIGNNGMAVEV
jgi:hypothetical protein